MGPLARAAAKSAFLLAIAICGAAAAQIADQGAKRTVLDLVYRVEDLAGNVQDLQVKETDTEIRIELAADVLFDFDKAEIRPSAQDALGRAASIIRDRGGRTVRVEGHTDAKGSDAYNRQLSVRRTEAVKSWLIEQESLHDRTVSIQGFGATKPVAPNTRRDGTDDPDGRQKNRRVEIIVNKR